MSENTKKWYVVRTAGGKEKKAKEYIEKEIEVLNLGHLITQVLIPTEKYYQVKNGKRVSAEAFIGVYTAPYANAFDTEADARFF